MKLSANHKGALFMALAMASFNVNDALVKSVTGVMNPGQIMFVRGLLTSAMIIALAWPTRGMFWRRVLPDRKVLVRAAAEVGAALTYIMALGLLPLANTAAILLSLPLAVTLGAVLFLGETVGWRRWLAIISGFAGVLIVIRPGPEGFSIGAAFVIAAVVFAATRDLLTRKIDPEIPAALITVVTALSITAFGALTIAPLGGWQPIEWHIFLRLAVSSVALLIGYQCIVFAMRAGDISFVAPLRYTSLIWAIGIGIVFFGEIPDFWMCVGVAVIVASGLYAFNRENRRRAKPIAQTSAIEGP
ncbi:DMT family transporter [Rhizobium sp. TRM96647]|uniref:DMT family transporter n=1 Tax=unclassified Rhizobium TaxID=2613769 RepID=UPI0021E81377|nr:MULTISPECIES: DMT family transporter [unclassified Rhizobium]MCV3737675.1 DMT family transporter [Rhizobium sp. TRM96647]MCV3759594.1 DMT family transporter [Rhizobium sp. TRM96650]